MNALWQIILAILWRLRPVMALETNLHDAIQLGLNIFTNADHLEDLGHNPARRQRLAAAFFDAHRKLDLLIYLRACELAGITTHIGFKPDYSHTHASTDLVALWASFERLVAKFDDYERLAAKRAERLKREQADYPLRLAATLQSTSPALCAVEDFVTTLCVLPRRRRGRWIGASSRRDGGGCASSRGPPYCPFPIADCPLPQKPSFRERIRTPNP